MICDSHTKVNSRIFFIVIFLFTSSCIYFNTFYNAKDSFKEAQKIINTKEYSDTELPPQAKALLDEAIINSRIVIDNFPDSKYVEEAYYIIAVSKFLKEDYLSAVDNLNILINDFPKGDYANETILWLAFAELRLCKLRNINPLDTITELDAFRDLNKNKLNRYEKYLFNQFMAEYALDLDNSIEQVYGDLENALKYASTDREKINIYNKLISISESNNDYANTIIYLDDLYEVLEDEEEKKEIKLTSLEYNKKINRHDFLIGEIEALLDLSLFSDKRLFLNLELAKAYYSINEHSTSKSLLQSIVEEYSRKKETAEAYYYLSKIQMHENFDFTITKDFLEKSKSEKSSSKYGKMSKELLSKIESLEDFIYEYNYSLTEEMQADSENLDSDSLLFSMAQSFYFDLGQIDSSVSRHSELVQKFSDSKYAPKSIFILSEIDSSNSNWKSVLDSSYGNFFKSITSNDKTIDQIFDTSFYYAIDLLELGFHEKAYELFLDNLENVIDAKFYIAYINEVYLLDVVSMIKYYIDYVNENQMTENSEIAKEKLSFYYYLINQELKSLQMKRMLSICNSEINQSLPIDSIQTCFNQIDSTMSLFSDDSLEVKFLKNNLLKIPYRSFKSKVKDMDVPFSEIDKDYRIIKEAVLSDSVFNISSAADSILSAINFYLTKGEELDFMHEKIENLSSHLLMYEKLIIMDIEEALDSSNMKDQNSVPFENLEFKDLKFDKLKLNLNE